MTQDDRSAMDVFLKFSLGALFIIAAALTDRRQITAAAIGAGTGVCALWLPVTALPLLAAAAGVAATAGVEAAGTES